MHRRPLAIAETISIHAFQKRTCIRQISTAARRAMHARESTRPALPRSHFLSCFTTDETEMSSSKQPSATTTIPIWRASGPSTTGAPTTSSANNSQQLQQWRLYTAGANFSVTRASSQAHTLTTQQRLPQQAAALLGERWQQASAENTEEEARDLAGARAFVEAFAARRAVVSDRNAVAVVPGESRRGLGVVGAWAGGGDDTCIPAPPADDVTVAADTTTTLRPPHARSPSPSPPPSPLGTTQLPPGTTIAPPGTTASHPPSSPPPPQGLLVVATSSSGTGRRGAATTLPPVVVQDTLAQEKQHAKDVVRNVLHITISDCRRTEETRPSHRLHPCLC